MAWKSQTGKCARFCSIELKLKGTFEPKLRGCQTCWFQLVLLTHDNFESEHVLQEWNCIDTTYVATIIILSHYKFESETMLHKSAGPTYIHRHNTFWVQPFWLPHGNLGSMQQPYVPKESMYQTGPSLVTWYIDPETWSQHHFQCTSYVIVIVTVIVIVIWPKGSHAINLRVLTRDIESSKITVPVPTS